jgi:hypothetical protein
VPAPADRAHQSLTVGALVAAGVIGAAAYLYGHNNPANLAVLQAARASGPLAVRLGHTGSPLPVLVAYFWSTWGLAVLGAGVAILGASAAWHLTAGLRGPLANIGRLVIVGAALAGFAALAMLDVRTALVLALAISAWRHLQDFTLRGMVQSGFYGGLLLAAAAAVQPSAACWALALAWACFLLPGRSRSLAERASGALVVAFPGVAIACLWGLMRLVLGGTWRIEPPTPHPAAFAAAACAGVMLWISLVHTGRSGAGAATIPVLLAGGAGVLGPGLATLAIPVLAVLTVITLTIAAHWAAVRLTLVGLAATVATLGAFSTVVGGAAPPLWSSSAALVQVDAARAYHGEATQTVGTSDRPDRPPSRRAA